MSWAIVVTLLFFAALGFAGAGIALAVARSREQREGESDLGMRAVTLLLFSFGSACTFVATGLAGVLAYGFVIAWFSYVFSAHRLDVFRLESPRTQAQSPPERRRIA